MRVTGTNQHIVFGNGEPTYNKLNLALNTISTYLCICKEELYQQIMVSPMLKGIGNV